MQHLPTPKPPHCPPCSGNCAQGRQCHAPAEACTELGAQPLERAPNVGRMLLGVILAPWAIGVVVFALWSALQ